MKKSLGCMLPLTIAYCLMQDNSFFFFFMIKYLSDFNERHPFYGSKCIHFYFRVISFPVLTFDLF